MDLLLRLREWKTAAIGILGAALFQLLYSGLKKVTDGMLKSRTNDDTLFSILLYGCALLVLVVNYFIVSLSRSEIPIRFCFV